MRVTSDCVHLLLGLLVMTMMAGCDTQKTEQPFEIIDSGVVANSAGGGHVVWLDNETIVFTRRLPPDYPPPHTKYKINFSLWTWNFKTNEFHMLSDDSSDRYCKEEEGLLYYRHAEQHYSAKPILNAGRYELEDVTPIPENHYLKTRGDAHCHIIDNANPPPKELFEDLRAFDAQIIKRWPKSMPEEVRDRWNFEPYLVSPQFPEGKHIPEIKLGTVKRYFKHAHQYLVRRLAPHVPLSTPTNEREFEYWLLSSDGSMTQIPIPHPWPQAVETYLSKKGLIIASDNIAKDPKLSQQGVWLFSEDGSEITELASGYSHMEAISPDGCKLAFSHEPKILPLGKGNSSLKVINLCS